MSDGPPLSASDLRIVAEALEPIETLEALTDNPAIGRIEVVLPDNPGTVIGYFVREGKPDGSGEAWIGFALS